MDNLRESLDSVWKTAYKNSESLLWKRTANIAKHSVQSLVWRSVRDNTLKPVRHFPTNRLMIDQHIRINVGVLTFNE